MRMLIRTLLLLVITATDALHTIGVPSLPSPTAHRSVRCRRSAPIYLLESDASAATASSDESLLRMGATRALVVVGASCLSLFLTLPAQPEFWRVTTSDFLLADTAPLLTLAGMGALVVTAWSAFGTDLHPITATARGVTPPPPAYTFQVLGLSGVLLASAGVALSFYPLPVAASGVELAHCVLPFFLWQVDVLLLRWMMPHVPWEEDDGATSLAANYGTEHASALGAALALLGVGWFEVYVQQFVASPLTLAGWPLLASAGLIALNAGFVNHRLANGVTNGLVCTEFYWTVSLMFGLSNSVVPVGIYHHLMYSMPRFVRLYDAGVEAAPTPWRRAALVHGALAAWHLALFAALALAVPPALTEPLPAVPSGPSLLPASISAAAGLVCFCLFSANTANSIAEGLRREGEA